jgi:hypothetical protein
MLQWVKMSLNLMQKNGFESFIVVKIIQELFSSSSENEILLFTPELSGLEMKKTGINSFFLVLMLFFPTQFRILVKFDKNSETGLKIKILLYFWG